MIDTNKVTDSERLGWTSASNALADSKCPGRHLAQRNIPEPPASKDASKGTVIHEALSKDNPAGLTMDELETFDACRELEAKLLMDFFGDATPSARVFREQRYWVGFKDGSGVDHYHSCRTDFVARVGDRALVLEYKTGRDEVEESPANMQLRDQQCIVRGHFLVTGQIGVAVIQPWVSRKPSICVYEPADSARARDEMFARVVASNRAGAERIAGEDQCKFCKAKRECSTYSRWVSQVTPPALMAALESPVATWTPEHRARVCTLLSSAEKFIDDIKAAMKEGLAADPAFVPGWELAKGRRIETIKDPNTCFSRFNAKGGSIGQFMRCVSIGKTKLKEELSGLTKLRGKALDAAMEELLAGIVDHNTAAPSLRRKAEGL